MRPIHRHCARRGFTLVELLVVVAIIALLIAILLPALGNARLVAVHSACLSNIRQQNVGLTAYTTNNKGRMPRVSSVGNPSTCEVWDRVENEPHGFGLMIAEGVFGDNAANLYCPGAEVIGGWGSNPTGTRERQMSNLNAALEAGNARMHRADYALGWWGGSPSLNEFESGEGFGRHPIDRDVRMTMWVADCFGRFTAPYRKLSHKAVFMPYGRTDGSAHTISNWQEHQPDSGGAGYYHMYNDRPGWGFWRYFGSDLGVE